MRDQILDIRVALPPSEVAARLAHAAAAAPRVFGQAFQVAFSGTTLSVSPPPFDQESPRAVISGTLEPDGTGTRVRLSRAGLAPSSQRVLAAFLVVGGVLATVFAVEGWRNGQRQVALAALGFLAFVTLILALLRIASAGTATDAARDFVRRALADAVPSSSARAAG
jgi:hypothetical protein